MAIFKIERCPNGTCTGYRHNVTNPGKKNLDCPKCGTPMYYLKDWYIEYYFNGIKKRKAVGPVRKDAEAALGKIMAEIREGKFFEKADLPDYTWKEATTYVNDFNRSNCSPVTAEFYETRIRILAKEFGDKMLSDITPVVVEQYKLKRSGTIKKTSVNREIATLKRIFEVMKMLKLINENPIANVKIFSEKGSARSRYLTEEEKERLLWCCRCPLAGATISRRYLHMAVLIALETGLRRDGVYGMKWDHINWKENKIVRTVKRNKTVEIPLTPRLREELQRYRAGMKVVSAFVFPSIQGEITVLKPNEKILNSADMGFNNALQRAGIKDFHFHDLRHTFATLFYRRTRNWKALQEILGHEDISMTMGRYAHLMDDDKIEAMKIFSKGDNGYYGQKSPSR